MSKAKKVLEGEIMGSIVLKRAEKIGDKVISQFVWSDEIDNLTLTEKLSLLDVMNQAQKRVIGMISKNLLFHLKNMKPSKKGEKR